MSPGHPQPASPLPARLLVCAGLLLWCGGLLAPHSHATLPVRLAGLLLLAVWTVRRRSLTPWIFFSMLAGIEYGLDLPHAALASRVFSDIFLRLIKCIVAPLIFGTLVTGIAGHSHTTATGIPGHSESKATGIAGHSESKATGIAGHSPAQAPESATSEHHSVARLGWKSLLYFEVLTTAALAIGLAAINLSHAGVGVALHTAPSGQPAPSTSTSSIGSWQEFLLRVFPDNIARAVADNQILEVAVFALLFGLALHRVPLPTRTPMLRLIESLTQTMFAFTNLVMYLAPLGVGTALAYTVASAGIGVMGSLGRLLLTLYVALAVFALGIMLPVALLARIPLRAFLRAIAEPAGIAFATSTSEAALPRAIESMEAFGVPRRITGFVIPAGYSFNLAGSALYLAIASIFVAQAAGMRLGWQQQLGMLLVLMLTSKGVAGVPRAVLVVLLATAGAFHLPEAPIFLILGIDALLDMGRTVINVTGNCLAAAVIAQWEGVLGSELPAPETFAPDRAITGAGI